MSTPGWSRRPMWRRPVSTGAEVNRYTKVTGLEQRPEGGWDRGHRHGDHRGRARRQRRRALGARGRQAGGALHPAARHGAPLHRHRAGARAEGPRARDHQHVRLHGRDLPATGGAGRPPRHLRAGLPRLGGGRCAGRLPQPAPAGRPGPDLARVGAGLPAFPGAGERRRQEGRQWALHLRAGRQPAGRARQGSAEFLAGVRRDGGLQPGRRDRPRPVALDGGERPRPGRAGHGRGPLRPLRDPALHPHQGRGKLPPALPLRLSERGAACRQAVPAHARL